MRQRAPWLGAIILLGLLPCVAHAGVDVNMAEDLRSILSTFESSIKSKVGLLHDEGRWLTWTLATIAIAWLGIQSVLRNRPFNELVGELVVTVFVIGMVSWVATGAEVRMNISEGFDKVANKVIGTVTAGAEGNNVEQAVAALVITVVRMTSSPMIEDMSNKEKAGEKPEWYDVKAHVGGAIDKVSNAGSEVINMILVFLYQVVMAVMLGLVALAYLACYVMSQVMVGIALIIAPVIVPFYLIQPLSFLATGWFQFFVGAALAKVGGALMMALTMGFVQKVADDFMKMNPGEVIPFTYFIYAFLLLGVMAFMMMQVWNIGSTIASGPARVGMAMPSSINPSSAGSKAGKAMESAGKNAPGSAVGAMGGIGGAVTGGRSGAAAHGTSTGAGKGVAHGASAGFRAAKSSWESNGQNRGAIREGLKAGKAAGPGHRGNDTTPSKA